MAGAIKTTISIHVSPTSTFQTPVFIFPTVNPLELHIITTLLNVTINCTVTWEGEPSQLTIMWSYNGTMIVSSQKYVITKGNLLIIQFEPEDAGTYECIVKHPSGWNDSRQYIIITSQGKQFSSLIQNVCINNTFQTKLL